MKSKTFYIFIIILLAGIFMRAYNFKELFQYSHDQDLSAWIVRDILDNHHFRLIGQETSVHGVFIGGFYYYLLIPFFLLFNLDPIGGIFLSIIISTLSIISIFYIFKKIFNTNTALIGAVIYSFSLNIVFTDREVVPTQPVLFWSIWYFYAVWLVLKGKQKQGFFISAILISLIWHLNLGLAISLTTLPLAIYFSKKFDTKSALKNSILAFILSSPLLIFELRHDFMQTKAIFLSVNPNTSVNKIDKLNRALELAAKNVTNIFHTDFFNIPPKITLLFLLYVLLIFLIRKIIDKRLAFIMYIWLLSFVIFFTFDSINLSEYYLNGMNIVWIAVASVFISRIFKRYKDIALAILWLFIFVNIYSLFTYPINKSGYVEKRQLISFIKQDAIERGYPCIAISYITEPGRELGYRYLFRIENMHVNPPKSESPVYTIVFPHSMVDRIDRSFGALGLIYPDYQKYNLPDVQKSCQGENPNLTDPLFGYTN